MCALFDATHLHAVSYSVYTDVSVYHSSWTRESLLRHVCNSHTLLGISNDYSPTSAMITVPHQQ